MVHLPGYAAESLRLVICRFLALVPFISNVARYSFPPNPVLQGFQAGIHKAVSRFFSLTCVGVHGNMC